MMQNPGVTVFTVSELLSENQQGKAGGGGGGKIKQTKPQISMKYMST